MWVGLTFLSASLCPNLQKIVAFFFLFLLLFPPPFSPLPFFSGARRSHRMPVPASGEGGRRSWRSCVLCTTDCAAVVECVYVCNCASAALASPAWGCGAWGVCVGVGWEVLRGFWRGSGFSVSVGAVCWVGGHGVCRHAGKARVCPQPWVTHVLGGGCPSQSPHCCLTCPQATATACRRTDGGRPSAGPRWTAGGHGANGQLRTGPLRAVVIPGLSPVWIHLVAAMNGLSISQLCCLFCCPPCPSRIAAKLAFLPPEPTYAVVPEPEPVGSTSTGSLRGGAAGRWKLHLKDRADFQYSQRELDNIEVFVTKSSRGNRVGCMYVRCVPGAR